MCGRKPSHPSRALLQSTPLFIQALPSFYPKFSSLSTDSAISKNTLDTRSPDLRSLGQLIQAPMDSQNQFIQLIGPLPLPVHSQHKLTPKQDFQGSLRASPDTNPATAIYTACKRGLCFVTPQHLF
ncbi:hypothetical protein K458DRAFT_413386 [Lentithecium fluviatile CBS 122367]|uniref:Uncharacterized protein n=1 Tax=Lentithecium fluviatile CBS 122367 TaxID=1168545 RepID=A0A6G1JF27_9PLEO|nr:hypothetical protein K458DRAFT_413386 [Lentithecium fluviatile CBS 122367]